MEVRFRKIPCAILAGGKSSRMGRNKALLELGGKRVIERVIDAAQEICSPLFIVSDDAETYRFLNLPVYPDIYKNSGPLGGIHSALHNTTADRVLILSCDLPFVIPEALRYLISNCNEYDAVIFSDGEKLHPLCGVYQKKCQGLVKECIVRKELSIRLFLKQLNMQIVALQTDLDPEGLLLKNLNTIEDYEECLSVFNSNLA